MAIGANWAEIWKPVWKQVWTQSPAQPVVSTPVGGGRFRHFGASYYPEKKKPPPEVIQIQEEIKATKALKREILPDLKSGKLDALARQRQRSVLSALNEQIVVLEKKKARAMAFHRAMEAHGAMEMKRREESRKKARRRKMVMALLMD